jgi:hypothetical protein
MHFIFSPDHFLFFVRRSYRAVIVDLGCIKICSSRKIALTALVVRGEA